MRITSKGQVTIPVGIREKAGLKPGMEVDFVVDGQTIRVVRRRVAKARTPGERAVAALRGKATLNRGKSTEEIMALLRPEDD